MKFVHFSDALKVILNVWEPRVLVLCSLFLQIILIFSADFRKRNVSWVLRIVLWSAYLLADVVATFALGFLAHSQDDSPHSDAAANDTLLAFWSPFLLLHLGGPDTITAFSLEDNELWRRHLLGLVFQVFTAAYVFVKALSHNTRLLVPTLFMFATGLLKYGERTWALFSASMLRLRSSMLTPPDSGPNYAKFMEAYESSKSAGLQCEISVEKERHPKSVTPEDAGEDDGGLPAKDMVRWAYQFFLTFRLLIVDLILTFEHRIDSQSFFLKGRTATDAFKVVEIELSFIYDVLHTKAAVVHNLAGRLIRFATIIFSTVALLFFIFTNKRGYNHDDVIVTYILSIGAVVLEIISIILMFLSPWTFNWLLDHKYTHLASWVFRLSRPFRKHSWSNQMAGYNLITFCREDEQYYLKKIGKIINWFGVKDSWDQLWFTKHIEVPEYLKEVIFRELKVKITSINDTESYKRFSACRGEWALRQKGYYLDLGWSVDAEFDESILLWHIATDLCYYDTDYQSQKELDIIINISRAVSDYMLYLLLELPFMLTAGIGQIRYGDTCADVKHFFGRWGPEMEVEDACESLLRVNTDYDPILVKGDRSKSVLFDACKLAQKLNKIEDQKTRWDVISHVWVEMLCFAATKCRGNSHAKQLSLGGELLTHVWLLMAHMGIGEQYRIEAGHARAKLFVDS
ncbi:hypothetical protein J5N97_011469 [Dioscorea zingiberensis]|uniref:DUF4220 domain-containing protein n=1 Tax=Dioscorea zingiberensis TaxID=325984 RepID=A0A9D5D298_9LILI|nr:hypothetical protein J5N97_011469 [Dioscorea zingiberensis]